MTANPAPDILRFRLARTALTRPPDWGCRAFGVRGCWRGWGMRLYWELAKRGFQRAAAYRAAALSGAITNTFFGFLRAYLYIALYQARPEAGGYNLRDALTFVFITQGMAALVELWAWWPIAETVKSGAIASDLTRPYNFELAWLAQDWGRALFQLLARSLPPLLIGLLVFDVRLPAGGSNALALIPSLWLAVTVSFAWRFCLNLSAFWLTDYRGVAGLGGLVALLLSGFLVPVAMFPDTLRAACYLLPFASFVSIPIDIYLGKVTGMALAGALTLQTAWAVAGLLIGRQVLAAALRKLVIQGG